MPESAAQLLKRFDALWGDQGTARQTWQDIADYIIPHKSNIIRLAWEGQKQTQKLFDSTAPQAAVLLSAALHGTLTPSTQPWLSLEMRDDALMTKDVDDWLEDCATRMYKALRASNFNTAIHELDQDVVTFATAVMLVEEKPPEVRGTFGGLRFRTVPVGTFVIAEDFDGLVDTVFRTFKLSARAAQDKWGDAVGERIASLARTKPDQPVEIIHAVYPRTDYNESKRNDKNMPWASCYLARDGKGKIEEGGYLEFPYVVPRWARSTGEVYGRGPSHTALPDIKTLNAWKEFTLKALPLAMQPPSVERSEAVVGEPDLTPGGRNVVEGSGSLDDQLKFMQTGFRMDIATAYYQEARHAIEAMYYKPQLELTEGPQMTATEIQVKYELMQRMLGPTMGRLEAELLNPLVDRIFRIMARAKAFRPMPQELARAVQADAADLDVRYEGPLARAQRSIELTAQDRTLGFIGQLSAQLAPVAPDLARSVWDVARLDDSIRARAAVTGLPSDQLNSEQDVQAIREARQQAQAQQAQAQTLMQGADALGKAAPALKELKTLGHLGVGNPPPGVPATTNGTARAA